MRYVAKVYVTDVMDQVVVSGYVFDADAVSNPDHTSSEFTYQTAGTGESEPLPWLLGALYRALVAEQRPGAMGSNRAVAVRGPHTVSGLGLDGN